MADLILTLDYANSIIERVNALAIDPPSGCTAVTPLELFVAPKVIHQDDVLSVRAKLLEICPENVFNEEVIKVIQPIYDEIEAAISRGWCNCECDPCPEGTNGDVTIMDWIRPVVRRDMVLNAGNACQPTPFDNTIFDWRSIVNALTNAPKHRGNAIVQYQTIRNGLVIFSRQIGSVEFACDGSVKTPIPPTSSPNVWDVLGTELYDTACSEICDTPFGPVPCCLGAIPCGSDDDAAQKSEADALAAAAPVIHDHWYVHRTCFGSCVECCDDGKGFKGRDCPA